MIIILNTKFITYNVNSTDNVPHMFDVHINTMYLYYDIIIIMYKRHLGSGSSLD